VPAQVANSTNNRRQNQVATPVTWAMPPHTPPSQRSERLRCSALMAACAPPRAGPPSAAYGASSSRALARWNSSSVSLPR